jgi:hypothetical protein
MSLLKLSLVPAILFCSCSTPKQEVQKPILLPSVTETKLEWPEVEYEK